MPKFKAIYEDKTEFEALDEPYRALYAERDGKFELAEFDGISPRAEVDRTLEALRKERADHAAVRARIRAYGDLTPEQIQAIRDEAEDLKLRLEAAGKDGKGPTEEQLNELLEKRMVARLRPLERERDRYKSELEGRDKTIAELQTERATTKIVTKVRATGVKLNDGALEDFEELAPRIFEVRENGDVVTKDGVGYPPGLTPKQLLEEFQAQGIRPHWFPVSQGAGARPGNPNRSDVGPNPFEVDPRTRKPNLTAIGVLVRSNPEKAVRMAVAAKRVDLLPERLRPKQQDYAAA